jgi:uncharacterized protein
MTPILSAFQSDSAIVEITIKKRITMLHEYRDIITHMKENQEANAHFLKIFERHNELDDQINKAEKGDLPLTDLEVEDLKKKKLLLKDEAYGIILKYKQDHNL